MSLHAAARQPYAELYMGLVEAGVGLIPGGGGCKELALASVAAGNSYPSRRPRRRRRSLRSAARRTSSSSPRPPSRLPSPRPATTASSSRPICHHHESRAPRYRCCHHAPPALAEAGYTAPTCPPSIAAPGANALATLKLAVYTMRAGQLHLRPRRQRFPTGPPTASPAATSPPAPPVTEQYLLDLEREAFLSLCGEKKTQDRIAFTLKTGKPLRN